MSTHNLCFDEKLTKVFFHYHQISTLSRLLLYYRNDPKFSDRQVWANSADPDQTAPLSDYSKRSSLIRVSTVCYSICIP